MTNSSILIVDDTYADRLILKRTLTEKGNFQVFEADGDIQCFDILNSQAISLVLMDVVMPGRYGTEILLDIRKSFNPIELPIIMVTSSTDSTGISECLQNGANDYITKPLNFQIALSRIKTHLMLAELSNKMSKVKEMEALSAVTRTYNHEINNALAIALNYLSDSLVKDAEAVGKLKAVLWKIAEIMKAIQKVTEDKELTFEQSKGFTKMIKIR